MKLNEPLVLDPKENPFAFFCVGPSLTKQAFKDDCDINKVVARINAGADASLFAPRTVGSYEDVSNLPDLRSALELAENIKSDFGQLNASVRDKFNNDVFQMLEFMKDPKNIDECVALGLFEKPVTKEPAPGSAPPAP